MVAGSNFRRSKVVFFRRRLKGHKGVIILGLAKPNVTVT
jgi:hypothetical protein